MADTTKGLVKDPERQRLGRLGALTVHARGRTNTVPARAAWEASLAAEYGITGDLTPPERERRLRLAMRVKMTRLARARWSQKAASAVQLPEAATEELSRASGSRPS